MPLASLRLPLPSRAALLALGAGAVLAGCSADTTTRSLAPISNETLALFDQKGVSKSSPTLIRTYKKESELEIWKQKPDGSYVYVKTFPMCRWSGQLGPKRREGDRQVPEGFYAITPGQMNPNSNYYLSFNIGYPNAYDRAHGASGGLIMVHGACSSAGCFSMTDQEIAEIYAIARESFAGGQRAIQMQSLPFHMTAQNLAKYRLDPNMPFWRELKKGADLFDVSEREPTVGLCGRAYGFSLGANACSGPGDATVAAEVAAKESRDSQKVAELVAAGVKPVRLVYADGGQNTSFRNGAPHEVSRPDALAQGPTEIVLDERTGKPLAVALAGKAADDAPETGKVAAAPVAARPVKLETAGVTAVSRSAAKLAASPAGKPATGAAPVALAEAATQTQAGPVETTAFYKRWLGFGAEGGRKPEAAQAIDQAAVDAPLPLARPKSP